MLLWIRGKTIKLKIKKEIRSGQVVAQSIYVMAKEKIEEIMLNTIASWLHDVDHQIKFNDGTSTHRFINILTTSEL